MPKSKKEVDLRSGFLSPKLLALVASLVTLAVSPGLAFDPINVPKFVFLVTGAALFIPLLIKNPKSIFDLNMPIASLSLALLLSFIFALLSNNSFYPEQLWGIWGRSTGIMAYSAFIVMMFSTLLIRASGPNESLRIIFERTSYVVTVYAIIQYADLDPIPWSQKLPFATLGNINFMSSFLGLASISMAARVLFEKASFLRSLYFLSLILLNLVVVVGTGSIQGIGIFLSGIVLLTAFKLRSKFISPKPLIFFAFSSLVSGILTILGTLGVGPFSRFEQETVLYRLDYWRAGVRMTLENLTNGVGVDSYGYFYKEYRDLEAIERTGPERVSNTAHNVFLDISSGAGIFAGFIFASIFLLALYKISVMLYKNHTNSTDISFSAISLGYLVFCSISINQLGVAIWGFIALGYVFGIRLQSEDRSLVNPRRKRVTSFAKDQSDSPQPEKAPRKWAIALSLLLGFGISVHPLLVDSKYFFAEKDGNYSAMREIAESPLTQTFYREKYILSLVDRGLDQESLDFARIEMNKNSRSEIALRVVAFSKLSTSDEKELARKLLRDLDPLNKSLEAELNES